MPTYAKKTKATAENSEREIKATVRRYGASEVTVHDGETGMWIAFKKGDRVVRIEMAYPDKKAKRFWANGNHQTRTPENADKSWKQECAVLWRNLLLFIKAQFAAIECGLIVFDKAFLPFLTQENGATVYDVLQTRLDRVLTSNFNAALALPAPGEDVIDV